MFAIIILLFIGTQHQPPLNEITQLDTRRKILGLVILIIFILSFAPIPFAAGKISVFLLIITID